MKSAQQGTGAANKGEQQIYRCWCRPRSSGISHALRIICRAKPTGAAPKSPATLPAAATRRAEGPVAGHQRPAFAIPPATPP